MAKQGFELRTVWVQCLLFHLVKQAGQGRKIQEFAKKCFSESEGQRNAECNKDGNWVRGGTAPASHVHGPHSLDLNLVCLLNADTVVINKLYSFSCSLRYDQCMCWWLKGNPLHSPPSSHHPPCHHMAIWVWCILEDMFCEQRRQCTLIQFHSLHICKPLLSFELQVANLILPFKGMFTI